MPQENAKQKYSSQVAKFFFDYDMIKS